MGEREIAYCRDQHEADPVLCPCCGTDKDIGSYACQPCYKQHKLAFIGLVATRDAYYDLGVRLRAEGKMPPLAKSPAAPSVCKDCGGVPCDCEKEIWTYWYRAPDGATGCDVEFNRPESVRRRRMGEETNPGNRRGPVQRVSEPPYDFGKTSETTTITIPAGPIGQTYTFKHEGPNVQRVTGTALHFSEAALARALFDEDPRVIEFWWHKSEGNRQIGQANQVRVLDIAWSRNEQGWRTEAEALAERVTRVFARMGRKS